MKKGMCKGKAKGKRKVRGGIRVRRRRSDSASFRGPEALRRDDATLKSVILTTLLRMRIKGGIKRGTESFFFLSTLGVKSTGKTL